MGEDSLECEHESDDDLGENEEKVSEPLSRVIRSSRILIHLIIEGSYLLKAEAAVRRKWYRNCGRATP